MEKESTQKQQEAGHNAFEDMQEDEELGVHYPIHSDVQDRLDRNFKHHPPSEDQVARYQQIREAAKELTELVLSLTPYCREQSVAQTKIEESVFWANAAIARNER